MIAIYNPNGKAKEYCPGINDRACNIYDGCGNGCIYCYVPNNHHLMRHMKMQTRAEFYANPRPREGIIEALKIDAKALARKLAKEFKKRSDDFLNGISRKPPVKTDTPFIFLCFTSDPYQPINKKYQLTRQAIEILHENGLGVNILTKGEITDWDLLAKNPHLSKVGVTLTGGEAEYEPNATHPIDRFFILSDAKKLGIKTWVSIEPVINPKKCLLYINLIKDHVDEFKIGKWNYSPEAKSIDWYRFTNEAVELLEQHGCKYYIKKDLQGYIDGNFKLYDKNRA